VSIAPSASILDEVVDVRRQLHRHPEVAHEESWTTDFIESRMRELGLHLPGRLTPTGSLGLLDTGRPGRTVMIRADIDALPLQEESGLAFSSDLDGRMHACGHDGHAAIALATARTLAEHLEDLRGRFLFCFQPAEEIGSGAREMIAAGILERHQPDLVLGLHLAAFLPAGQVLTRPGLLWAGADAFTITMTGPGGHGGMMGRSGNVIAAQAFCLERLGQVVLGLEHEGTRCHIAVGAVHSDGLWNVVSRQIRIEGSLRTFNPDLRRQALERLAALLAECDAEFNIFCELGLTHRTSPLINHPRVTSRVLESARELVGESAVQLSTPLTVSDDMAEFLTQVPGCYLMLGAQPRDAEGPVAHHSPGFRIEEDCLQTGVRVLSLAASRLADPSLTAD